MIVSPKPFHFRNRKVAIIIVMPVKTDIQVFLIFPASSYIPWIPAFQAVSQLH